MDQTRNNKNVIDKDKKIEDDIIDGNNGNGNHNDDDDDDDMSSISTASPMSQAETRQKERVKRAHQRMRQVIIAMVAVTYLVFQMETIHPKSTVQIMTKSIDYASSEINIQQQQEQTNTNNNQTKQLQRQQHIKHVAAKISKIYKPTSPNVWCIDGRLKYEQGKRRPMGLCYLKMPRSASSYLAGINQRISRNFAQRHPNVIKKPCIRHDGHVQGFFYTKRDPLSFLWTMIRKPSDRSLSRVAHSLSKTGNNNVEIINNGLDNDHDNDNDNNTVSTANTIVTSLRGYDDLQYSSVSAGRGGFQLQYAMLHMIEEFSAWNNSLPTTIHNPQKVRRHVSAVMNGYDFIGVVERMDESLVALKLLLGLETSDILQFPTKTHQQFQYMKKIRKCRLPIDPNTLREIPEVQSYLDSDEWFAQNYGDYLLYHAASTSLDRTILKIGLTTFSNELKEYRALRQKANEICQPKFPCSSEGEDQSYESQEDCYDGDHIGCGYACLDNLTTVVGGGD